MRPCVSTDTYLSSTQNSDMSFPGRSSQFVHWRASAHATKIPGRDVHMQEILKPNWFITISANLKQKEIVENLRPGETCHDRPEAHELQLLVGVYEAILASETRFSRNRPPVLQSHNPP